MLYIPRFCVAMVLVGFFLPWISVDFMGAKMSITGMEFATAKGPMGEAHYGILVTPILSLIAAVSHTKRNYMFLSIVSAAVLLLVGPIFLRDGAAEIGVSRGIGLFVCMCGLIGMFIASDFLPPDLKKKLPEKHTPKVNKKTKKKPS